MSRGTRTLTPTQWTSKGEAAIPHYDDDGRRVLVWRGIVGEAAEVELIRSGQNDIQTRFVRPAGRAHPARRVPACERYDLCGGCPLMHMNPDGQRDARLSHLYDVLNAVGLAEHTPDHVVPSPDGEEDYRHVAKLAVGRSDRGWVRLGTYARGTHDVVTIPKCRVVTPTLRELMPKVAYHIKDLRIFPYNAKDDSGILRHVVMRQSRETGQVLITLVTGRSGRLVRELADLLMGCHGAVAGVHVHLNTNPGNAIYDFGETGPGFKRITGVRTISERVGGEKLNVGPGDFFQANPGMGDLIARDVQELLAPWSDRPVVDLYSGVGAFTLGLARQHGWALGVEVVPGAVWRAEDSARAGHLPATFLSGQVADCMPEVKRRTDGRAPVVMVDPARRGLEADVARSLLSLEPSAVAYLSCNPRALAEDLEQFTSKGWEIKAVRAYDMFPQTSHLETLALLVPPVAPENAKRAPRRRIVR